MLNYYRTCKHKGVENTVFIIELKKLLDNFKFTITNIDKINYFLKIFHYLNDNNKWMFESSNSYTRFKHEVFRKIQEFYYLKIYSDILVFFPIKLCKYCLNFTTEDDRSCKKCFDKQMILYKIFPLELVIYIMNIAGVTSNKKIMLDNKNKPVDPLTINEIYELTPNLKKRYLIDNYSWRKT